MKAYDVDWDDEALSVLLGLYLRASDPSALAPAQHRADRKLEQRPRQVGTELSEGLWQLIEPPLKVFYEIDDTIKLVTVTHVGLA